jgi:hypothetical protein
MPVSLYGAKCLAHDRSSDEASNGKERWEEENKSQGSTPPVALVRRYTCLKRCGVVIPEGAGPCQGRFGGLWPIAGRA